MKLDLFAKLKTLCFHGLCVSTFKSVMCSPLLEDKGMCVSNDFQMTQHNVGALLVVKPSEKDSIAGIVTERGQIAVFGCASYPKWIELMHLSNAFIFYMYFLLY